MVNIERPHIEIKPRIYLPADFDFKTWDDLEPFYEELKTREIKNGQDLRKWLIDRNEVEVFLSEEGAWRYIHYTRNTEDETIRSRYQFFINEIKPKVAPYSNDLDKKFIESPFLNELNEEAYHIYIRAVKNELELYREENIALYVKSEEKSQEYADLMSQMTIDYQGHEYTLSQAARFMKDPDRNVRREIFEKTKARKMQDAAKLDDIFTELVKIRHQIALNAGFNNYRDYKFKALGRFDYTMDDVYKFHQSIKDEIVPLVDELTEKRKEELNVDTLRPYDLDVDTSGKPALQPYKDSDDLIQKTVECLSKLHPVLGEYILIMNEKGYLDLDSRKGKAPGGYNYPLDEVGIPFIFMNSSGKFRDLITMLHESGHAVHSFLTRNLYINAFKHSPSEVAELASMSMELLSMDYWNVFFKNEDDLVRAKEEQLSGIIEILPWIATIDKFQNWAYTHPEHTLQERNAAWIEIFEEFYPPLVNWDGYEDYKAKRWQGQLHIFETPFYYIEYGIAQLGALAVWKNYEENASKGLEQYLSALKLGYTVPVPEIYKTAGIAFDFSRDYIHELSQFIRTELESLNKEKITK